MDVLRGDVEVEGPVGLVVGSDRRDCGVGKRTGRVSAVDVDGAVEAAASVAGHVGWIHCGCIAASPTAVVPQVIVRCLVVPQKRVEPAVGRRARFRNVPNIPLAVGMRRVPHRFQQLRQRGVVGSALVFIVGRHGIVADIKGVPSSHARSPRGRADFEGVEAF